MRLIADTGPIVALGDPRDARRVDARAVLSIERETPVLSAFSAAEIDYHLQSLRGPQGNSWFVADLAAGRFELPTVSRQELRDIEQLNHQYRDLSPGIADLSIVVLAARYRTTRLLTFDQRHFRAIRPLQGGTFTLLPFDDDIDA